MKTFREFLEIANIQLDEGIRNPDVPFRPKPEFANAKKIMSDINTQTEIKGSTNRLKKLIRDRSGKPPEPRTPDRVGNPNAGPPSGEGLNPENKPPRKRVVEPYVPPFDPSTGAPVNLKDRTSEIAPFGTVYEPPAKPVKRKKG